MSYKQTDVETGCATVYISREEAAVLIGAVQTGKKHLTTYWQHKDFNKQHESEVRISMEVMAKFIDKMDEIVNDPQIKTCKVMR